MLNNSIYQDIFDEISKYFSVDWEKTVIYLEYGEKSYTFSFYVKENGTYIKCYDLPGVSEDELYASFKAIDKLISPERAKNNNLWTVMTMIVTKTGDMSADFDYSDISENAYQFMNSWKAKYLV